MEDLDKEIQDAYKKAGQHAYFGNGYKMGYESAKNKQPSINWQPFEPDNPPIVKGTVLVELKDGTVDCIDYEVTNSHSYFQSKWNPRLQAEDIKAYAIIKLSKF